MARFNVSTVAKSQVDIGRSNKKPSVPSVLATIDSILHAIAEAKHNKAHAEQFRDVLRKVVKTLAGVDVNFVRRAEYYNDLKETLNKIYVHVIDSTTRGKWSKLMMAKRDQKVYEEISAHVENLIGRIIFSYAQRVQMRKNSPTPASTRDLSKEGEKERAASDVDSVSVRSDSACSCVMNSDVSSDGDEVISDVGR